MFKIAQFAALLLITSVSLGQEVTTSVPPMKDSEWVITGQWVCPDAPAGFGWHYGRGVNCDDALARLECKLKEEYPGAVCTDANGENPQPPYKEYGICYEDGGGGGGENPGLRAAPPQDGPWVLRLIYRFGNGQTLAARGTGCTKCEAYQQAWRTIQLLAKANGGVCCGTGKCIVLKQPCCPAVNACRSRARCRHR